MNEGFNETTLMSQCATGAIKKGFHKISIKFLTWEISKDNLNVNTKLASMCIQNTDKVEKCRKLYTD